MTWDDPQDLIAVAGEYVLGTLSDAERLDVEEERKRNPALAAEIAQWQDRLLGLTNRVAPAEPSNALWSGIDAALSAEVGAALPQISAPATRLPSPAALSPIPPYVAAASAPAANDSFWRSLGLWRGLSGLAVAACLALATLLVLDHNARPPERYVAVLQSPDKQAGWIVQASTDAPLTLVPLAPNAPGADVPEGKALQFWTKIDGAAGPTSLGLVKPGQSLQVELSKLPGVAGNQLFEITLEPPAGSPIGKPTGPVLFIGRSVKV